MIDLLMSKVKKICQNAVPDKGSKNSLVAKLQEKKFKVLTQRGGIVGNRLGRHYLLLRH